jgi:hypothetical protein
MHERFLSSMITVAVAAAAVGAVITASITRTSAQAPAASATAPAQALATPWGEPDLQGIWTDEFYTDVGAGSGGFRHGTSPSAGRTRPAGHLDRRI